MKQFGKRLLSLLLVLVLALGMVPAQALAVPATEIPLPEVGLDEEILSHDVFYLASTSATVQENGNAVYLLRIGRGGPADAESVARIKIADMTAKYGEDYIVRIHDSGKAVDSPEDNFSLLELMENSDFDQQTISDEEDWESLLEADADAQAAYQEGIEAALEFLGEESGLNDKYADGNPYSDAVAEMYGDAIPANGDGEVLTIGGGEEGIDPVQQAANLFTGENATAQRLTSESDAFQDLQAIADVMTNAVVGVNVELTFAPGETEKYLEIVPLDNDKGDGNRMFYVILGSPSGSTTNSAASSCAFTIEDDEEFEPAVVRFSEAVYDHTPGAESVTVTVEREGAETSVVSVKVKTTGESTAQVGRDYSAVDTELVFPFGVDHLTLTIPVRTEYLTGEGAFTLALEPDVGCVTGETGSATVKLTGTYTDKDTLRAAQAEDLQAVGDTRAADVDVNNLQTVRLGPAMDVSKPQFNGHTYWAGHLGSFTGNDGWDNDSWLMEWIFDSRYSEREGVVGASWRLPTGDDYFWLSGFQMEWKHGGSHSGDRAWAMISVSGKDTAEFRPHEMDYLDLRAHYDQAGRGNPYYSYESTSRFGKTAMNLFTSEKKFDAWNGYAPYRISVYNKGSCDDCDPFRIYSIAPILRPFQMHLSDADSLLYLTADGSRSAVETATTTNVSFAGGGSMAVFYMDDSFTVTTPSGSNVGVYGYLKNLNWVDASGNPIMTLAQNSNTANTAITCTLTKDTINKMGRTKTDAFRNMLQKLPYNKDSNGVVNYGYANYARMYLKPELDYLNANVTLRNPYDFPVTMTIDGKDYALAAGEVKKINAPDGQPFHLGDTLAVSKITLGEANSQLYTAVGVRYEAKTDSTNAAVNKGTLDFVDGKAVNVSGSVDGRLSYQEVILEPNLQDKDNKIVVRVKTAELSKFMTEDEKDADGNVIRGAGLLAQQGVADGEYTYFTYADTNKTVSGKLYAITVIPLSGETVAQWYDGNTLRTYIGNTLYFTAGSETSRNIITLSAAKATGYASLQGTLNYANYNLRTGFAGNASNVPAAGAVLSAGSAGGVANQEGYVSAGPIPYTGLPDQYLRYIVSVNGTDLVKEIALPTTVAALNAPVLLWDFGADEAMSASMGKYRNNLITFAGESDDNGNDYYTFTATGGDPFVSMDTPLADATVLQWARVRIRNLCGAAAMELYVCTGDNTNVRGASCTQIELAQDTDWHEYIIHVPTENINTANTYKGASLTSTLWTGKVNWIRLDPMANDRSTGGGVNRGDQVQIDYVAFFRDEESARIYRGALPEILCDFGSDNAMNANMGAHKNIDVEYGGERDEDGNDYYTFTAKGYAPRVSLDNVVAENVETIQWAKLRIRNTSGLKYCWIAAGKDENIDIMTLVPVELKQDTEWHEYLINIPETNKSLYLSNSSHKWTYPIEWIGLYPLGLDAKNGDQIQIDYMAFFADEYSAKAFRNPDYSYIPQNARLDISANFPNGVSPVASEIFTELTVKGTMSDPTFSIENNTYIPAVLGQSANMTVSIKPQSYTFTTTGADGAIFEETRTEYPVSVQLVVYDKNDVFRGAFAVVDTAKFEKGYAVFDCTMEFMEPGEEEETVDENGDPVFIEPVSTLVPNPGDKLYLRLVTDRLAQTDALRTEDNETVYENYRYSDVFTGMTFVQPLEGAVPLQMGIDSPIDINYGDLPLVGSTGMNLAFPFVNVGIMKLHNGYRFYIGVSPVQIADTVKGTHTSAFAGAGGDYWKTLFSIKDPFNSFMNGMKTAKESIDMVHDAAKEASANGDSVGGAGLGSPTWRFDISVGVYFDFSNPTIKEGGSSTTSYIFNGMGGYVSVTLGFQMAWYIVLPVVFIPAYFGIEIQGTVMGFLGANFNKDMQVYYDSEGKTLGANVNDGISEITGGIRGSAYVQISLGVGLCGTLGIRFAGRVDMIANWEPDDPNGSWGFYVGLSAGGIIDLFLFSVPLMFHIAGWPFGSFEYYANQANKGTRGLQTDAAAYSGPVLRLREGSREDSRWLGSEQTRGAFQPNKDLVQILATNAYERPDSQLITLSDGESLALAFIDSDNAKGAAQRTTLKLSTCHNGVWSEPVTISKDDTADFQPSIAETKDGKLLVAWVSPSADVPAELDTDEAIMAYLNSMEVYAAFVELEDGSIKTKTEDGVLVADTEITRITNDHYTRADGTVSTYYDANPTVVCDAESGDAMVYFIKSGRSSLGDGEISDYINPYTNDCVVCYLPFNASEDVDTDGRTVPAGWLFNNFYYAELHGNTANEQILIDAFGGQRFLDGPVNANNERYTIPDFTAISYNGLALYAYTVDTDGKNDTDADKELILQIYDFRTHETKYKINLTNDDVADAVPQFFRSKVNAEGSGGVSTDDESTHTMLFWYRDGKQVVYLDVTSLIRNGINADGTLKTEADDPEHEYTFEMDGKTYYRYAYPRSVYLSAEDSHASTSQPDFKAVEDAEGNLYILWTEGVTLDDGSTAEEIFGTGLVAYDVHDTDETGETVTARETSGWSKPYRITRDGYHNDEIAVAMSGENLVVVHNRYKESLVEVPEGTEYDGQVDFMPLQITDMALVADTLEPCGSVETERITLYDAENAPVTLPVGGEQVSIEVELANNGMNMAEGYKLTLYALDQAGNQTQIGETVETTDALIPNSERTHRFAYTLPADVDGLTFKAVAQELRDAVAMTYYTDTDTFLSDPLTAKASYEITDLETYQAVDGFHAKMTVTNVGNAASAAGDTLNIQLKGPADLGDKYEDALYSGPVSLCVGKTKELDVPVAIVPEMMADYGFVTALVTVQKEVVMQTLTLDDGSTKDYMGTQFVSNLEYADFDLVTPMNMTLQDVSVEAGKLADIDFSMELGDVFRGGDDVTYAVDDLTVARIQSGKVLGVGTGETTLHATHAATGATVSAKVTVTGETPQLKENPFTDVEEGRYYYDPVLWAYYHDPQITAGTGETTFSPNDSATRAQLVTFLWRAAGCPEPKTSTSPFTDVPDGMYYTKPVLWAAENGITMGTSETTFSPNRICSRAEVVTFLYRFAGSPAVGAVENPFTDVADGTYYTKPVLWAVEQKVTAGTSETTFSPKSKCTRAQVVTFLYRYMNEE